MINCFSIIYFQVSFFVLYMAFLNLRTTGKLRIVLFICDQFKYRKCVVVIQLWYCVQVQPILFKLHLCLFFSIFFFLTFKSSALGLINHKETSYILIIITTHKLLLITKFNTDETQTVLRKSLHETILINIVLNSLISCTAYCNTPVYIKGIMSR